MFPWVFPWFSPQAGLRLRHCLHAEGPGGAAGGAEESDRRSGTRGHRLPGRGWQSLLGGFRITEGFLKLEVS